ncbi:MAG TPA: site-specific integrase [Gammaproteobacteria bacterium]|nr:site-specific integrase [Gammaproteobacteria bacterium]
MLRRRNRAPRGKRSSCKRASGSRSALTVGHAVREYLADREAEGQNTRRAILQLKAHVLPAWGESRVAELKAVELKAWRNQLATSAPRLRGAKEAVRPRLAAVDLSDPEIRRRRRSTVNRITTIFKAALNYAARLYPDECPNRTAWQEGLKAFRNVDTPRERWLTAEEAVRLLDACRPDFRKLVGAALYTGCRYGELCRAAVKDYDSKTRTLRIPVSKSGRCRHVVLHDEAAAFFDALSGDRRPDEPLLKRHGGLPWGRGQQVRPIARACRLAGIDPSISFHGLRHSYASLAIQSGMALVALARNLGHADTRMVEKHYGHLSNQYMREQVTRHAPVFGLEYGGAGNGHYDGGGS